MPTQNLQPTSYQAMIAEATGAPADLLPTLERIMREEVFHSTLDWQTVAEFRAGARKAHRRYLEDPGFHDAYDRHHRASYRLLRAENALAEARQPAVPPQRLAAAEEAARKARQEESVTNAALRAALVR